MKTDLAQLAAARPDTSTWLLANAGSGKTKVLVDRLLRLLLSGARPGGILCLTFTNTAANEMLKRVQDTLGRWLILDDDALDQEIAALGEEVTAQRRQRARQLFLRLSEDPEGLNIRTLHGFCQSLISKFPLELGVAPGAKLLENEAASTLKEGIRQSVLLDETPEIADARHQIMTSAHYSLLSAESFFKIIAAWQCRADMSVADFQAQAATVFGFERLDMSVAELERDFAALIDVDEARAVIAQISSLSSKPIDRKLQQALERRVQEQADWIEKCAKIFLTQKEGTIRKKIVTNGVLKDVFIAQRIAYWAECFLKHFQQVAALNSLHVSAALFQLVQAFRSQYHAYKTEHALLDYDDQIMLVRRLLSSAGGLDWVRYKLDCSIDHVFLDEAQDTSHDQWDILNALCADFFAGEKERAQTLFVVGDPKQSIYRFQGADAEGFFAERQHRIQEHAISEQQLIWSYRSSQCILDVVDATFARYRDADFSVGDETFIDSQHLSAKAGFAGQVVLAPPLEFELSKAAAQYWLARHLAQTIHGWIGKRSLAALGRTVQPEDILILFRKRSGMFSKLAHYLRVLGVPVVSGERSQFQEPLAIQDCIALMRYLLRPNDDYQLACVLKSAFIGLSEDALMDLALSRGETQSLHEVLMREESAAARWLADLRREIDFTTINALLGAILHRPCPRGASGLQALIGRFGSGILRPLGQLEQLAIAFDDTESTGVQGFVDHVLFRRTPEIDSAEGAGVVRLSTIHSAKGQQAPIVVVPEVWLTAELPKIKLYSVQGLPMLDTAASVRHPELEAARQEAEAADRAEHWRLLYVAMTRAAYELHLYTAHAIPKGAPKKTPWYTLISEAMEMCNAEKITDAEEFPQYTEGGIGFSTSIPARRYQSFQSVPVGGNDLERSTENASVPDWLTIPAAETPPSVTVHFAKKSEDATGETARIRGIALHGLLQRLCGQQQPLQKLEQMKPEGFSEAEILEMQGTIRDCLNNPEIAAILLQAQSELEVISATGDLRRLDCVVIAPELITIIDFKSDQNPTEPIPESYQRQLAEYRTIMAELFPKRAIRTGILWLTNATLCWWQP